MPVVLHCLHCGTLSASKRAIAGRIAAVDRFACFDALVKRDIVITSIILSIPEGLQGFLLPMELFLWGADKTSGMGRGISEVMVRLIKNAPHLFRMKFT